MKWSQNDKLFKKELEEGYKWQIYVAELLQKHGLKAEVPELTFRDNIKQIKKYADLEDIRCEGKLIEVKSRKLSFTCPDNFPYPTILIDTVSGWETKKHKPDAYVCISTITKEIIAISGKKKDYWQKVRRFDATRKIQDWFYECSKEYWKPFDKLVVGLQKLKDR
ncbi:MAG: hypothetical protein ACXAC5_05425 [Promethearchaeota archaeon]|jgi:hypothetical protein